MRVMYERLPDFCFCCGCIGHQYRECAHYKFQSKDEMSYGPWLKATTINKKLKQSRGRDRWESDSWVNHPNVPVHTKRDTAKSMVDEGQHRLGEAEIEIGPDRSKLDPGKGSLRATMSRDHMRTEKQLMKGSAKAAELADSRNGKQNQDEGKEVHWDVDASAGTKDGKENEREMNLQNKKSGEIQIWGSDEVGNSEREVNERKGSTKEVGHPQNMYVFSPQMESEVEDGDNGLRIDKIKPKKKKWKL